MEKIFNEYIDRQSSIRYRRNCTTFLSKLTFLWMLPILKIGYEKNLTIDDLGQMNDDELSMTQKERFMKTIEKIDRKKYKKSLLLRVCWLTFRKSLLLGALIKILSDLSSLIGPLSIGYILDDITQHRQQQFDKNFNVSSVNNDWKTLIIIDNDSQMIKFLNAQTFITNSYVLAIIVLLATILQSTLSNNFNHLVISEGIRLKSALTCFIYEKALRMPVNNNNVDMLAGKLSNHITLDIANIFQFFTMMHYLWSVPIKIIILLILLYKQMGIVTLYGSSIFFLLSPLQYYCSRQISKIQKSQLNIADKRVNHTNELFMGIKLLKLMGWELSFARQVKKLRDIELEYLRKDAIYVAINTFITQGSAILVTMITFTLYIYLEDQQLNASTVFTCIALFNQITVPLYIVPLVIPMLISAIVSNKRLANFFTSDNIQSNSINWTHNESSILLLRKRLHSENSAPMSAPIIELNESFCKPLDRCLSVSGRPKQSQQFDHFCCCIKNGNFTWYDHMDNKKIDHVNGKNLNEIDACILYDINVRIPREKLTVVVGSIGSGKSTLLSSLIGETLKLKGDIYWSKENKICFGYVPSIAWILNVSIKDNITFGRVFNQKCYDEVIRACSLKADIDLLPQGDSTIIGERGITLSGGQRQRIALARALYSSAPTLILDDSLSALDSIVGNSVFENAILKLAIKHQKRTVILATHRQEYLSRSDYVVVMESGTVRNQGTLEEVEKENKPFFYHRYVMRNKEILECLQRKPDTCTTVKERKKLIRHLSKKDAFRYHEGHVHKGGLHKPLYRQESLGIEPTLPLHEFVTENDSDSTSDNGDNDDAKDKTMNLKKRFTRLSSNETNQSTQSNQYSLNSSNSNNNSNRSQQNHHHAPLRRLISSISNYSTVFEEDDQGGGNASNSMIDSSVNIDNHSDHMEPCNTNDNTGNDDDESGDDISYEDETLCITEELREEITKFQTNHTKTSATIDKLNNKLNVNPLKNHVSMEILLSYLKFHSYHRCVIVLMLIIMNQTIRVVSDFWLAKWTESDGQLPKHFDHELTNVKYYLQSYIILSIISIIISLTTNLFAQLITINAVRQLHNNLLDTLVRCPLRFFDRTPIGKIMNRFTNDFNVIDKKLPIAIPVLLRFMFLCLSAIIVDVIICPYIIIIIVPILILYYYIQRIFCCTSRQLQRLESSSKSPIISHFNQTLQGLMTIRSFREQEMFLDKFHEYLDNNNLCFLMVNSLNCFLGILLDYFGGFILFLTMIISITAAYYWNVQPSYVGLAMTYTLLVPIYLNWLVRNLSQVEMNMHSVERIYHYTQLERENSCSNHPEQFKGSITNWPKTGNIEFRNVTIRYGANLSPIIYDASMSIKHGEKIGICGRTGSGKSSLISAIFRINEICSGQIIIDNVDITTICPYQLRKCLTIIPQDLVIFTGTIRDNLDPDHEYSDEKLMEILKEFQLDEIIESLDEEFDDVKSLKQRFSSGQRQLFCCARAFLIDSPILLMDESTSQLDQKSEEFIFQKIFNSERTIIAIVHHIKQLINFDKIAVVDNGHIIEFDTPKNLLNNTKSMFYKLYNRR